MSIAIPSDEVAEDYKNSLEDLTLNSRYEISNLTVIAKENTEHALAISRVLENHIRNTPPDRKLPALYVLDSVVKNVGTPYTLFLGRNLYSIFMNAYSLVNLNVRKKLDEMLSTWEGPVPGSLDSRPVFPPDTTRQIRTALIKARTAAIQEQQQQQLRTQREMMARQRPVAIPNTQWVSTPTPPQANGRYYPPPQQGLSQPNVPNGYYQQRPSYSNPVQYSTPQPISQPHHPYQQPTAYSQHLPAPPQVDSLHRDIAELVRKTKEELAANVFDKSLQNRLQALLTLQNYMGQQQLTPDQLNQVRDQINYLFTLSAQPPPPAPFMPQPQPNPSQHQHPPPPLQRPPQGPPHQAPGLQASLDSKNLADIIARAQRAPATPPNPQALLPHPQPTSASHSSTQSAPNDLLAALRAKGFFHPDSGTSATDTVGFPATPPVTSTPSILPSGTGHAPTMNDIELTSTSLKRPRPHLISALYEARPNQCSTCGKRFMATEEGKGKKARHLDWHFRTNQRLADSAKRGQSRSWYVDELEWIRSRDNPEDAPLIDASSTATKAALAASLAAADPKNKYITAPSDPVLRDQPCPICQEKFVADWNDELETFIWKDAIQIGSRVYHASCHSEVKKDGGNTPGRTSTPDSVLGKRKAAAAGVSGIYDINANNPKMVKA